MLSRDLRFTFIAVFLPAGNFLAFLCRCSLGVVCGVHWVWSVVFTGCGLWCSLGVCCASLSPGEWLSGTGYA